ncbi:outer membrane beta-barrel protein (plasmid) [Paracoccus sp. TK19116]|uniref:Outer membrane beta-barrel protein n=1 Tax=Paracoccus albicereus TaxID=2922394 RepID=A0ABT1MLR0_9RHOB|nr:outer membrane beta-barrel protein [Paracoccus albicereus]MCQ0969212.1 outer membrane beta-barrel protein [Paracoccus albicereus]
MPSTLKTSSVVAGLALMATQAANAGGYTAPVVATAPIVAPEVQMEPASNWAGGYAGGSLGYSFSGDDEVGLDVVEDGVTTARGTELGNLELSGATAGVHAGYRWQRDRLVFGPELGVEFGNVDDEIDLTASAVSTGVTASTEVNNILSLRFKTGYLLNDQTMLFGSAGVVRGDFDVTLASDGDSATESYNATGYSLGLGVERKLSNRMSLTAAYEYRDFGRTDVDFTDGETTIETIATPEHHNVSLGLNFSF